MAYQQGDLVWVSFPFTDGFDEEDHPAVILSARNVGRDITVARLTSQVAKARRRGEYVIQHWEYAKLDKAGAVRPKVFTIVKGRVVSRIGQLHSDDWKGVQSFFREFFRL